jgi:hypothetical protein
MLYELCLVATWQRGMAFLPGKVFAVISYSSALCQALKKKRETDANKTNR